MTQCDWLIFAAYVSGVVMGFCAPWRHKGDQ
jgi:hypothetical protein